MIKRIFSAISLKISEKRDNKTIFTKIYGTNKWSSEESISGKGSELNQTETLIAELNKLIKEKNIQSILDIPCGDFNWMKHVDLGGTSYIGADIVGDLIKKNIEKYGHIENISFRELDLTKDKLPITELIFVRDCLVHLSFENIHMAISNIKNSGSQYLLSTIFPDCKSNYDIKTGSWRKIDLRKAPFDFPEPLLIINEHCPQGKGKFSDKSMALWKISDI